MTPSTTRPIERRHFLTLPERQERDAKRSHWLKEYGHGLPDRRQSAIELKRKGER